MAAFKVIMITVMALSGIDAMIDDDPRHIRIFGTAAVLFLMAWALEMTMR